MVKEISVEELKNWIDSGKEFKLIDVREADEVQIASIGGELIPVNSVPENVDKFKSETPVVVYCRSGARSGNAVAYLQQNYGLENLLNLQGGILAWADKIDPSITKY